MENDIKVGSVVFHKDPKRAEFRGPGTVMKKIFDPLFGVDVYTVLWQSSNLEWDHTRLFLASLAEKGNPNG